MREQASVDEHPAGQGHVANIFKDIGAGDGLGQIDQVRLADHGSLELVLDAGGAVPTSFAVSAHEAYVWEIRLIGAGVSPVSEATFDRG